MTSNYEKLVKYLNEPNKKNKPPLGVEGDLFDRFVRCAGLLDIVRCRDDADWEQPCAFNAHEISVGNFSICIERCHADFFIEVYGGITLRLTYLHNESETDNQFVENIRRILSGDGLKVAENLDHVYLASLIVHSKGRTETFEIEV